MSSIFRAGSILCCGEQSMHTELRVRTVCELTLNEEYYLQPSIVSFCAHKNILLATSANFNQAAEVSSMMDTLRLCFQLDCCDAAKSNTYSNMWHMHGLSSVLKQPIYSIYPQANVRYRPFYNKRIQPRAQADGSICQTIPFLIMWTRVDVKWTPLDVHWQPNHFVPCRLPVGNRPLSHAGSPLIQDVTDSHAAPPSVQDRPLSHAGSPLIQDVTDSHAAPPSVQDRPLSHAGSPLIQDVTDSHAAPPSVQDRPLSHAGSPLIQDVTDSHAAPPSVQDRPLSHAGSPLIQDVTDSHAAPSLRPG